MNFLDVFGRDAGDPHAIAAGFLASHLGFLKEADQRCPKPC